MNEEQSLEMQYRRQAALADIELAINQPDELRSVLDKIVSASTELLPATHGASVILWDSQANAFFVSATTVPGLEPRTFTKETRSSGGVTRWVMDNAQPCVVNDVQDDPFRSGRKMPDYGVRAYVGMPLLDQGKGIGVLFAFDKDVRDYSDEAVDFLNALARRAEVAISKVRLYEQLQEAKKVAEDARRAAEAANQAKSTFLANMSHELRTPLNAILGFTQLMGRDDAFPARHQNSLGAITRSGEHLLDLINDVLEMSKIEAGRSTLEVSSFEITHTLHSIEEMVRIRAEKKGLQLIFECNPNLPHVIKTDERKLRQVLLNLLGNAVKFTGRGGVTLRVGLGDQEPGARVQGETSQGQDPQPQIPIRFEVEDTGSGIGPEELDILFEPFTQTQSGQQAREGTGLGLPISRHFVRLMGGEITVQSHLRVGALFRFDIQVGLADGSEVKLKHPTRRVIGLEMEQPKYRILVVDDSQDNRTLLRELLDEVGFTIKEAVDGEQAIDLWERWQPHLIWMDIRMPVMDGYQATQRIKSQAGAQAPVIIALTASAFEEQRSDYLSAGCDDFVRKPFHEDEIFDAMGKHLGVRYVYRDLERPDDEEVENATALIPEALASLPVEWVASLREAASWGDINRIHTLIEQIQSDQPLVAKALSQLAGKFKLDEILALAGESLAEENND